MAEEILEMVLEQIRSREDFPGMEHAYNYVFELTTWDPDTGEIILDHEYRTYATDDFLSEQEAYAEAGDKFTDVYGLTGGE